MTLDEMCIAAARHADRYDEMEKVDGVYEDDAEHYFNVFRDAINEAYFEISRNYGKPDMYKTIVVPSDGIIDLTSLDPVPYAVLNLYDSDRKNMVLFHFNTRFEIVPEDVSSGTSVVLYYQYHPDRLEALTDEPIFPESIVDPMVYISLAVARIWLSEKKIDLFNTWMNQYYAYLREINATMRKSHSRRIPRRVFR